MAAETPAPEVMGPGIPAGLTATADAEGVVLRWTAPAGAVDGYNVYRCAGAVCDPEWIASVTSGTTYLDDGSADPDDDGTPIGLTPNTNYRYAVAAYLDDGAQGDWVRGCGCDIRGSTGNTAARAGRRAAGGAETGYGGLWPNAGGGCGGRVR